MSITFEDMFDELLCKVGLKYLYYEDSEHPEISKKINEEIDRLRNELNER